MIIPDSMHANNIMVTEQVEFIYSGMCMFVCMIIYIYVYCMYIGIYVTTINEKEVMILKETWRNLK